VRLLRGQGGYTLIELLAVMAIFMTVVTALTQLFVRGAKAELDANRRFEAQSNARLALDKLRRELHCSSGLTQTNGSALSGPPTTYTAVRVTLPSHCPGTGGAEITVDYATVSKGANRWELRRTRSGGTAIPVADYVTNDDIFQYTAQNSTQRALLHVEIPVNINPNEGWKEWRLVDDIVLRNTLRQ
jgi:prepilin-type N-terminal cleavage/methylation domain-containing protein